LLKLLTLFEVALPGTKSDTSRPLRRSTVNGIWSNVKAYLHAWPNPKSLFFYNLLMK